MNFDRLVRVAYIGCVCGTLVVATAWLYLERPWLRLLAEDSPLPPPLTWEQAINCDKVNSELLKSHSASDLKMVAAENAAFFAQRHSKECRESMEKAQSEGEFILSQGENIETLMRQFEFEWTEHRKRALMSDVLHSRSNSYLMLEKKIIFYSRKNILPLKNAFARDANFSWSIHILESLLFFDDSFKQSMEILLERFKKADRFQGRILEGARQMLKVASLHFAKPLESKPYRVLADKIGTVLLQLDLVTWQDTLCYLKLVERQGN